MPAPGLVEPDSADPGHDEPGFHPSTPFTVDDILAFLLRSGDLEAQRLVDEDFEVVSVPRRNRNLRIASQDGTGFLIKQPEPGTDGHLESLRSEAGFYALCQQDERLAGLRPLLPRWVRHDLDQGWLILELLSGTRPLGKPSPQTSLQDAHHALGKALGLLHATFRDLDLAQNPWYQALPWARPGILSLHRPRLASVSELSGGQRHLLRIVQEDANLLAGLSGVADAWRRETLIHGDVKSENVLVLPGGEIRLVDWELAQPGDPAWDLAGGLQNLLLLWIQSMPGEASLGVAERALAAELPLAHVQVAARAFWQSYRKAVGQTESLGALELLDDLGIRGVTFSAARLLQGAYEHGQLFDRLPSEAVMMVQMAANIFADPQAAASGLYGLTWGGDSL